MRTYCFDFSRLNTSYCLLNRRNKAVNSCYRNLCSGWSRISQKGVPTYYLANFSRKLHENEDILGRGRAPRPLYPPMLCKWKRNCTFCLICTTALQKSFASTRWQSSHMFEWTVNSTTNTCCNTAPFKTYKRAIISLSAAQHKPCSGSCLSFDNLLQFYDRKKIMAQSTPVIQWPVIVTRK